MRAVKAKQLRKIQAKLEEAGMNPPRRLRKLEHWLDRYALAPKK